MLTRSARFPEVATRCWRLIVLLLIGAVGFPCRAAPRTLAPDVPAALGNAWLWLDEGAKNLHPFVAGSTAPQRVLYQPLPAQFGHQGAGRVRVRARAGQCFFLNNQLIFTAPASGTYTLDFSPYAIRQPGALLAIWHPSALADPDIFLGTGTVLPTASLTTPVPIDSLSSGPHLRPTADPNRNVFIVLLVVVGLLYGALRTVFGISLSRFLRLEMATRQGSEVRVSAGALPSTSLTVLFGLGFALSFALLIVVVQSNAATAMTLRTLFPLTDADIMLRVALYTCLVIAFGLLRFVFLSIVGYVFDLVELVGPQYVAFVRTLLLAGAYVPPTILLHLVLAGPAPAVAQRLSNFLLALLLLAVAGRATLALRARQSFFNLHLFAYLCTTEVIPLLVLFRLIVTPLF